MSKTNGNAAAQSAPPANWAKIQTDRPIWKPERGEGAPIRGFVLGLQDMPPANGRPWQAFVIKLTEPTKCKSREGKEILVPAGEEVLAAANHKLVQHLGRAACHPKVQFEVWIKPDGQTKTTAGSITNFQMHVNPTPVVRDGHSRMLALQSSAAPVPQLPEQTHDAADDLPF
jgi:hypothetical protein